MELVERDEPLAALGGWLGQAGAGAGCLVLVAGEAGIGKTSLVREFCERHRDAARVWWGACDALSTPRPLGPLYDIARAARGELAALMASDASRHERFAGLLDALAWPLQPTIAVFEDVHWADEATRDLLLFVARRVADVNAMVLVTYRDDEVGGGHPLRQVLGNIATLPAVRRVAPSPLTRAGVAALAEGGDTDPDDVHLVTGGNPFFVTEVLASYEGGVPETVTDAVLVSANRLSRPARQVLDVAAVVPDHAELELLRDVSGRDPSDVEECVERGLLVATGQKLRFRHELARLAVEGAIPALRRPELHRSVLDWLRERPGISPARLSFHAEQAGDAEAILAFAPVAAEEAARLGSHREALAHRARALRHADLVPDRQRADLLWRFMEASRAVGRFEDASAACDQALELLHDLGDVEAEAHLTVRRAGIAWNLARNEEARSLASSALAMLESMPEGPEHAHVLAAVASLRMLARDIPGAIDLGTRALELAERYGDDVSMSAALGAIGAAQWFAVPDEAEDTLRRALEVARRSSDDHRYVNVLGNLGSGAGEVRRYAIADRWLAETITWGEARDLDYQAGYARAWSARSTFEQGRWAETDDLLDHLAQLPIEDLPTRIVLLTTQGRLRARRGDAHPEESLEQAWELASMTGDLQRLWPAAAGRAEAAWLDGRTGDVAGFVRDTFGLAVRLEQAWAIGELGFWLWCAGELREPPVGAAEPFALQIAGDWEGAARAWEEIGCPYEVAVALADGDDPEALRRAFTLFAGLGAAPMADRVAARLRELGVHDLPRRPSRATVDNPGGLTDRQVEVLGLLGEGRTNPQIAAVLHISPKTVGHHVSAILDRLGVADRREAARLARDHGLISD